MQVQWREYHEVVGTCKPYLMQKIFFELFALRGGEGGKVLGMRLCHLSHPDETFNYFYRLLFAEHSAFFTHLTDQLLPINHTYQMNFMQSEDKGPTAVPDYCHQTGIHFLLSFGNNGQNQNK